MAYEYTWTAHTSSVDQTGNIYFPKLFEHADDGIQELLETIDYPLSDLIREDRYALPIVHAEVDYLAPISHGDRVSCAIRPDPGESSITFGIEADIAGDRAAAGAIVRVYVDLNGFEKHPLPDGLRSGLEQYG